MKKYIKALEGISYGDWELLKIAIDRAFTEKKKDALKHVKIEDSADVERAMLSMLGGTAKKLLQD